MIQYKHSDENAEVLTAQAGQFNVLLKHYLLPLGWTVLEESGNILYLQNSFNQILKSNSQQNFVTWQGFRNVSDIYDDQKSFPTKVQNSEFVVCEVETDLQWTLFASEFFFYFILNSELYGFGSFIPVFFEDTKPCFLLGKSTKNTTQKLFTNLGIFETSNLSVASTRSPAIPWSTPISFSYDQRIDAIKDINQYKLPLSVITIHETENNSVRGLLPSIYVVSSKALLELGTTSFMTTFENVTFSFVIINGKIFVFEV